MGRNHQAVIPTAPEKVLEPTTPQPVFHIGDDRMKRLNDPTVAVAITINVDIKNGEREMSATTTLHELPLLRRLYTALGGTVEAQPAWVPGIRRRSKLSRLQLQDELERLNHKYVLPTEGGKRDIMAEVYGATGAERLSALRDKMIEANALWKALEDRAVAQIRADKMVYHPLEIEALISDRLTNKDVDKIVGALDPEQVAVETIELDELTEADLEPSAAKDGASALDAPAPVFGLDAAEAAAAGISDEPESELNDTDLLISNLRADGLTEQEANTAAIIVTSHAGPKRDERFKEDGFKGKALAAVKRRAKEYDAATAAPSPV